MPSLRMLASGMDVLEINENQAGDVVGDPEEAERVVKMIAEGLALVAE